FASFQLYVLYFFFFFFFQAEDGIRDFHVTGVQTCALPICVSAQPTIHGENIVLRILDRQKGIVPLDGLGLDETQIAQVQRMVARSEERRVGKECRSRWSTEQ